MRYRIILLLSAFFVLLEKICNALWGLFTVIVIFSALCIMGIVQSLPTYANITLIAAFGIAALYKLWGGICAFLPFSLKEVSRKTEKYSGINHRLLDTIKDRPLGQSNLWHKHLQNAKQALKRLQVYSPDFKIAESDHYAVRYMALLILIIALSSTPYRTWQHRLQSGIIPKISISLAPPTTPMLDVWTVYPEYAGKNPDFIISANRTIATSKELQILKGSTIKIKASGFIWPLKIKFDDAKYRLSNDVTDIPVKEDGLLKISTIDKRLGRWNLKIIDDKPASIEISKISATASDATKIEYKAKDDLGIKKVEAAFTLKDDDRLVYKFPLSYIPQETDAQSYVEDLNAHIWAGKEVTFALQVEDSFGHISHSNAVDYILPQRKFRNIASKRIAAVRQGLMKKDSDSVSLAENLAQVAIRPQLYHENMVVFMALSTAIKRIAKDDRSEELLQLLWDVAVQLEDGGLSTSQKKLHQALQKMQDSLNNPSLSAKEKQELAAEVKNAIAEYLRDLVAEMQAMLYQGRIMPELSSKLAEKIGNSASIDDLLKKMQEMADADSYKSLADIARSLKDNLENFDLSKFEAMQKEQEEALQAMQNLEETIKLQQHLLDETLSADKKLAPTLAMRQEALKKDLGDTISKLSGVVKNTPPSFASALGSMESSTNELMNGALPQSANHQTKALEDLQKANDAAADAMASQMKNSLLSFGFMPPGKNYGEDFDPLGRKMSGEKIEIPKQSEIRTIRQIIEELRRRANNPDKSETEKEYLERLIP